MKLNNWIGNMWWDFWFLEVVELEVLRDVDGVCVFFNIIICLEFFFCDVCDGVGIGVLVFFVKFL